MKILLVNDKFPPEPTTVGRIAADLARMFVERGHQVSVFTTHAEKINTREEENGMVIYRMSRMRRAKLPRSYGTLYNPTVSNEFKKVLRIVNPDIVLFHNVHEYLSFSLFYVAKKSNAKVLLTAHDAMLYHYGKAKDNSKISWLDQVRENKWWYNPIRKLLIQFYLRYVDKIISVSNALKIALNNNGIRNVEVIHNGLDLKNWETPKEEIRAFIDTQKLAGKKIILFVGRLSEDKGGEQIIKVLIRVVSVFPEAQLVVMGQQNSYSGEMLALAGKLHVAGNIIFTGWLSGTQRVAAFCASHVIVYPSIYNDPFGMVNIEAMACAKPVIASSFGGASEIVEDGTTGYVVNPFDTEQFADRISKLFSEPDLAERMGRAGQERVCKSFTVQQQADEYLAKFKIV